MYGPGRYEPDPTEGITTVKDLPAPQLVAYHRDHKQTACPRCSHLASRHKSGQRLLHDLGDLCTGHPVDLLVAYSSHYCVRCTPLSRQFQAKIKIDCYKYKLKYTAAGVR